MNDKKDQYPFDWSGWGSRASPIVKPTIREAQVEKRFCARVKERLGGAAPKFTSPAKVSVPDRLVLLPIPERDRELVARYIRFVELKRPGEKPTEAQQREHQRLRDLGFTVDVLDSYEAVEDWTLEFEV